VGDVNPSLRIGALGLFFLSLFAVLALRLWTIQITETEQYDEQAANNQVRIANTPAPRGEIRDRNGELLAGTRPALAAVVDGALVSRDVEADLVKTLSAFSGVPESEVQDVVDRAQTSGDRITLVSELDDQQALYLVEHREDFPGVSVVPQPVRVYPQGPLAAHVIGYIGRPDATDLEKPEIEPTDVLGKAGVERHYDFELRGTPGIIKYSIDAQGRVKSITEQPPVPGETLILTLDADVQAVLEETLAEGLQLARDDISPGCEPSPDDKECPIRAVGVVLDATDGSVLAMSSVPSFDPSIFIDGLTQEEWEALSQGAVFNNFAIQGVYAPASTFKTVAFVTALEHAIYPLELTHDTGQYTCDGQLEFRFQDGSPQVFRDWLPEGHGPIDLHGALHGSCDLYFWEVALRVWNGRNDQFDEDLLQQWARKFGFDQKTGIDLPFEKAGLIPDREWFERVQEETPGRVREGPWVGGDVMNVVLGQGEVLVTPLQLANAYAGMVNGGTVWQPRIVDSIVDEDGEVILDNPPQVLNRVELSDRTARLLRQDLQQVVNGNGTARSAFVEFGERIEQVGGKTGTAEVIKATDEHGAVDTAWFVGVAPVDNPKYVVAIVVERGGSGGRVAAPMARRVMQFLLNGEEGMTPLVPGAVAD
jgi:penicillin-binding protein 2